MATTLIFVTLASNSFRLEKVTSSGIWIGNLRYNNRDSICVGILKVSHLKVVPECYINPVGIYQSSSPTRGNFLQENCVIIFYIIFLLPVQDLASFIWWKGILCVCAYSLYLTHIYYSIPCSWPNWLWCTKFKKRPEHDRIRGQSFYHQQHCVRETSILIKHYPIAWLNLIWFVFKGLRLEILTTRTEYFCSS